MRLLQISSEQFAGLRDVRVDLEPGLNLIVGPNEAGKSTIFAAVRHSLLTPTRLTKSVFARTLARYLPRPDGDAIECGLVLQTDARYQLRRRWGADPQTTLKLPSGTQVSGDNAHEQIVSLLTVSPGTYRALYLVDQATLDRTVELLEEDHDSREELLGALRNQGAGGISVDAFLRILRQRIDEHFSRWDRDRDGPEQGRGIDHPWEKSVGVQLKAWYEWKREEGAVSDIENAETALEAADEDLRAAVARERGAADFVDAHQKTWESLRDEPRIERELEALSGRMNELRSAARRWPVLVEDERRLAAELEATRSRAEAATAALRDAGAARERAEARKRLARIDEIVKARADASERLEEMPNVDDEIVLSFRKAERDLEGVLLRLNAGELRARVTVDKASEGGVTILPAQRRGDGDTDAPDRSGKSVGTGDRAVSEASGSGQESIQVPPGASDAVESRRHIAFEMAGIRIEVETGEESYANLVAAQERAESELVRLRKASGATSSEEARALADQRAAVLREVAQLRDEYAEVTKGVAVDELRKRLEGDEARASGKAQASAGDEGTLAEALASAREELGATETRLAGIRAELAELEKTYTSQDGLEDAMLELRGSVRDLEGKRASSSELPEGFEDVRDFLTEFERRRDALDSLREARESARLEQVTLLSNLPDRTAEEARESCAARKAEFERAVSHGKALLRLERAAQSSEAGESPGVEAGRRLARYLELSVPNRFRGARVPDGRITPAVFASAGGPELEYALLSQGTRDVVSLALRLALAEAAAPENAPPLLLDDPLVDMDADRRAGAARAIAAYANGRQVLLFTCHPEHAELFDNANVFSLPVV